MLSTGIAGQVWAQNVHQPLQRYIMCEWSYKLNTKKYLFVPCLGIVLSIVVTFLAAQKMLIYSPHICALAPTLPRGLAVEMVIPSQVGLEKSATQFFWELVEQNS